ncbi:Golgi-associated plant pathogenesis-related protein 1 isoform X2 [Antennarius striatus]|uniref:Golgi-associated plant pathogenesis-related protein 1 isoform X2 n=1 Tax=Antennarius striatus TaxID=241820 RepID=UPI0035B327B1
MADDSFKREFLETHNKYRAKHNSKRMTLKEDLNASAQSWADHLLSTKALAHSKSENGENVYYKWSSAPLKLTGKEAVESWYDEINSYNFGNPGFASGTGHFTQVVWNNSTELGVGMATDGNYVFVVGQYRPAGNIMGQFQKNVLPAVPRTRPRLEHQ